jgi:catechol 2,3-dioxygenase-like lactoylglutathione lyase family enzyme
MSMSTYEPKRPLGANLLGVSHLALNSSDMAKTVEYYEGKLGLPLVKTMALPGGMGQHFFFDIGNGDCLAFFWWNDELGVPAQRAQEMRDGAMNHVAFRILPEAVPAWWDHLTEAGVIFAFIDHKLNDQNVANDMSKIDDQTYAASFYLQDPDGAQIEFSAWFPAWDRLGRDDVPASTQRPERTTQWLSPMLEGMLKTPAPA